MKLLSVAISLVALIVMGCSSSEKAPESDKANAPTAAVETPASGAPTGTAAPATPAPAAPPSAAATAASCDEATGDKLFGELEKAATAYEKFSFPAAGAKCEPLRLATVKLAPLAKEFTTRRNTLRAWSQKRSDACRARSKEIYTPRLQSLMKRLQTSIGPQMKVYEKEARACKDHPGMAEAMKAASMKVAN